MTNSPNKLLLTFAFLLSTGCQQNTIKDEASPYSSVPVGSVLILNKPITIQPEQVAVFVQHGNIVQAGRFDIYRPNCKFELFKISEQSRIVPPGKFTITKIVDEMETVQRTQPLLLAMNNSLPSEYISWGLMLGSGENEMYNYATVMYLSSDTQQDVYRMTCKHWESIIDDNYLSIQQMRKTMGKWFTLEIN